MLNPKLSNQVGCQTPVREDSQAQAEKAREVSEHACEGLRGEPLWESCRGQVGEGARGGFASSFRQHQEEEMDEGGKASCFHLWTMGLTTQTASKMQFHSERSEAHRWRIGSMSSASCISQSIPWPLIKKAAQKKEQSTMTATCC